MELFKPSNKVLEMISSGKTDNLFMQYNPLIFYKTYTGLNKDIESTLAAGLFDEIREYYDINYEEKRKKRLAVQFVWNVFGEAAKNCVDHSPKGKEFFTAGFYFGDKGVCYGFNDGGDYFKDEKIKYQYENKIRITDFDKSTFKSNAQSGVNSHIYPYTDLIEVDSNKGILYCVQLKDGIIAPEGKDGNDYCYDLWEARKSSK